MDPKLLRHHSRVKHEDKATCWRYYNDKELIELKSPIDFYILDISAGGVGIRSDYSVRIGDILIFDMAFGLGTYKVMAKVKWCSQRDGYYRSGLEFVSIPFNLRQSIIEISKLGIETPAFEF